MAIYGNQTNSTPRQSGKPCDVCGVIPEAKYHRHVDCGRTITIEKHATNRIKVEAIYAEQLNRPELANKYLCVDCYNTLISIPLNKI